MDVECETHEMPDPCHLCWVDLCWELGYRGWFNPDGSYSNEDWEADR